MYVCLICYLLPLVSRASFIAIKSMFISLVSNIMFMYIYVEHSLHIFMFIAMYELRESFYEVYL